VKSDYSVIAHTYDRYRSFAPRTLQFWLNHIVNLAAISPGLPVLDLGCGTGRLAIPLANGVRARVYGLDLEPAMIAQAVTKEGSGAVGWAVGDATSLPFRQGSFGAVIMALVIHHMQPNDRPYALASILRSLAPGGRLVIWTSSHQQIRRFPLAGFFPSLVPIDLERFPPLSALMAEMREAGFVHVQRRAVVKQETVDKHEFLEKVRNRYISTLRLIGEDELAAGIRSMSEHLSALPGSKVVRAYRYTFVTGQRSAT